MGLLARLTWTLTGNAERRSTSGSPFADMLHGFANTGFSAGTAGQPVTDTTALGITGVYAAVRNISDDIAKMDKEVFRKLPRGKVQILNHPMHRILCQSPNPEMGTIDFIRALVGCALIYGNGYARVIRDRYTGEATHAYPIHPWRVRVLRDNTGLLYYSIDGMDVAAPGAANGRVELADMIHLKGFGLNGLMGLALTRTAKESLSLTMALEQFGASFFGNSAMPRGYFSADGTLSPEAEERFLSKWNNLYQGASNANKSAMLQAGVKWNAMSMANNEGQFLESRAFQLLEVCRLFRMPPHKLMDVSKGTMNNMEVQAGEYVGDCLLTWIRLLEEEFKRKLTRPDEVDIIPKFIVASFFRGDMTARSAYYASGITNGYFSRNDVREMEDKNPEEGLDTYLVPITQVASSAVETMNKAQLTLLSIHAKDNGVELDKNGIPQVIANAAGVAAEDDQADPVDQATPEVNVPPPPGIALPGQQVIDSALYTRAAKSLTPLVADALRRSYRTEGEKVVRAAKKDQAAVDTFYGSHPEHLRAALAPVLTAVAASYWSLAEEPSPERRQAVEAFITGAVAKSITDSRAELATEIELSGIESRTSKWTSERPERTAETLVDDLLKVLVTQ